MRRSATTAISPIPPHTRRKFNYVNPAAQPSRIGFLAQLNQQGSSGYMYKSDAVFSDVSDIRSVYVKDNSRSDQFLLNW